MHLFSARRSSSVVKKTLEKKGKNIESVLNKRAKKTFGGPLPDKLPQFLLDAFQYIEENGTENVGIFRKSPNKVLEDKIVLEVENDPKIDFKKLGDVTLAASLIKRYFRSLDDPLMTSELYHTFIAANSNEGITDVSAEETPVEVRSAQMIRIILRTRFPVINYSILKFLCEWLKNNIVSKSSLNMMNPHNLAIVFQPNILFLSEQNLLQSYKDAPIACNLIKRLIESPEYFFDREITEEVPSSETRTSLETIFENKTCQGESNTSSSSGTAKNKFSLSGFVRQISSDNRAFFNSYALPQKKSGTLKSRKISNIVYDGSLNERGEKHGFGKFMLPDGRFYLGEFYNDFFHGTGTLVDTNGTKYEGDWEHGVREGKGKEWSVQKGKQLHYDGQWHEDKYSGEGKMIFSDGSIYEGHWYNGMKHGYGKSISENRGIYEGNWFNNKKHGYGILIEGETLQYSGEWVDNKYHGKGILELKDTGERYEGEFSNGEYNGKGTFTSAYGECTFTGIFRDGQPWNGSGAILIDERTSYVGVWLEGSFNGNAKVGFTDGRYFEGDMVEYKYEGFGVLQYADGTKYSGQFLKGKRHGEGTLTSAICTYIGDFVDGLFEGHGRLIDTETKVKLFEGEFKEDQPWSGKGTIYGASRDFYLSGGFKDGSFTGHGVKSLDKESIEAKHYEKSGIFDGDFVETMYHGKGKITYSDGSTYEGTWEEDLRHGNGIWVHAGKIYDTVYDHGKLVSQVKREEVKPDERLVLLEKWKSIKEMENVLVGIEVEDISDKLLGVLKKLTELAIVRPIVKI